MALGEAALQSSEPCFSPQLSHSCLSVYTPALLSLMDTCGLLSIYNHSNQQNLALVSSFLLELEERYDSGSEK